MNTVNPLVVIITPTYNGGKFLDGAMKCVQNQTYSNILHIVLNNCSSDNTFNILEKYRNSNITVAIYENNIVLQQQDNWNKAFSYIPDSASYVKLLCDDDLMKPDAIERLVKVAESDPGVNVVLSHDVFDNHVRCANLRSRETVMDGKEVARLIMDNKVSWLPYHHFFMRIPSRLRGKNFLGNDWSQDVHIVTSCALNGKFGYVHEPLVFSRYHSNSVTAKEAASLGVNPELVQLALLQKYGAQAYAPAAYRAALQKCLDRMCRYIMRWRLTGHAPRAVKLAEALGGRGLSPNPWHFVRAVVTWPSYALEKLRWKIPDGDFMDETTFLHAKGSPPPVSGPSLFPEPRLDERDRPLFTYNTSRSGADAHLSET